MATSLTDFYRVNRDDTPVTLTVIIGFGQNAVSTVFIDQTQIKSNEQDGPFTRSFDVSLGKGKDLPGKNLYLNTIVHDISPETDKTSVTVKLSPGALPYESKMEQTAPQSGVSVSYTANIEFL